MSSMIVKGMKMPKSCGRCWFNNSSLSCAVTGSCIDRDDENRERLDDCPFVALPDHHGRLIDADKLKEEFPKDTDWEYPVNTNQYVCEMIDEAKTVIEAED